MHGLAVIGTSAAAGEPAVAAAAVSAARAGGVPVATFVATAAGADARSGLALLAEVSGTPLEELSAHAYETLAPPLIAARHDGHALEPAALLDAALAADGDPGRMLVVATGGGLLAPVAARYTNRDFARELELPVLVAAAAGPDMLNQSLLTIEAATGAGLAVAAVVLTDWPEAPGRVLLDERALLEQQAGVAVVALTADAVRSAEALAGATRTWPVAEWARASAGPARAAVDEDAAPARVTLEPYRAWEEQPAGDPRTTPRARIMDTLLQIVGAEGPMTATRAYALYNRAAGGRKLTTVARAPLSSSVYWLAQERKVVIVRQEEIPWQADDVVRMPDSPAVRVRELGPRSLEEVPLDEIAELVKRLRAARGVSDAMGLKRAVLNAYGLVRLTARADEYLGLALDLADD
jgi:dethiobiotin synthetase